MPTRKGTKAKEADAAVVSAGPEPNGRREQLLNAAIELFSEQGFHAASMSGLARSMRISKPALYHYVDSKDALLVELYERVASESNASVTRLMERNDLEPLAAFREAVVERITYTCENQQLLRVFFESEADIPKALTRKLSRWRRSYEDAMIALLNQAADAGELTYSGSPRVVMNTILGASHWTYKWYDPHGELPARELAEHVADMLLSGLLPRTCGQ